MIQPTTSLNSSASVEEFLAGLVEALTEKFQTGEEVDLESLVGQYPEHADRLRQLLPAIRLLADLGGSSGSQPPVLGLDEHLDPAKNTLGDYRISREIGRGGMGVVYEAEQISLERRVALKVLPFAAMLDNRQLQRFKHEAQAAAGLHHSNIVPVFSVGSERGVHFYAMQYVDGQTLADLIRDLRGREGVNKSPDDNAEARKRSASAQLEERQELDATDPMLDVASQRRSETVRAEGDGTKREARLVLQSSLSTERSHRSPTYFRGIVEAGMQVAEALDYAHGEGVVHRDVKPSNLILDAAGKVWVTDFGLAQVESQPGLTMPGDLLGTLRYMSPEQALAKRVVVDHRTDIYSLGVTLYELLTLTPPFCGQDKQELLRQIAFDEPTPLRRRSNNIPTELQTIVLKAMAKNPIERYETAGGLAADLQRFLEHKPILAKPPTLVQRVSKWTQRHKPLVAATFVVLLLATVGLTIASIAIAHEHSLALEQKNQAEREKAETERQLRRATSLRLAGQAQLLKHQLPEQSALLGIEAIEVTRGQGEPVLPLAQESLRASLAVLGGRRLLPTPAISAISPSGQWMATGYRDPSGDRVRLWDLEHPWPWQSHDVLRGQSTIGWVHAVSSDSRWIVTAPRGELGKPQSVYLWDTTSRDPLTVLGHSDAVINSNFSADSRWLATGDWDKTVRLYDLTTPDVPASVKVLEPDVGGDSMAISPDSRWLATAGKEGHGRLWDLSRDDPNDGVVLLPLGEREQNVRSLAFGPRSRWLATASGTYDDTHPDWAVRLWDLSAENPAERPRVLPGHRGEVEAVEFSPDGRRLVSAGLDRTAQVWDLKSENPANSRVVLRHPGGIWDLAISSDSQWLLTACGDHTVRLWNLLAKDPSSASLVLRGHERWVPFAAFNADGTWAITDARNGVLRVWDLTAARADLMRDHRPGSRVFETGVSPRVLRGHESSVSRTEFLRTGKLLTIGMSGVGRLWKESAGNAFSSVAEFVGGPRDREILWPAQSVSPSQRWLAIGNHLGQIHLWDLKARDPEASKRVLQGGPSPIGRLAFSANNRWLAATNSDGTLRLWDLNREDLSQPLSLGSPPKNFGVFLISPDSRWLATRVKEEVFLWDLSASDPASTEVSLPGHEANVNRLGFSPDGRWLASGSADQTVRLWDLKGPDPAHSPFVLRGHEHAVWKLAFSADSRWLITSCSKPRGHAGWGRETIRLWDTSDEHFVTIPVKLPSSKLLWADWAGVRNPAGSLLVTLGADHTVRVHDLSDSNPSRPFKVLRGAEAPQLFAVSPDRRWLAAGEQAIWLWDLEDENTSEPYIVLRDDSNSEVRSLAFTPDSQALVTGESNGHMRVWDVAIDSLIKLAQKTAGRELTDKERKKYGLD